MVDVSNYTNLITSQHADKPKFMATVAAITQPFVDFLNFANPTLALAYDLDTAIGVQLDAVGMWIGRSRNVTFPISGIYFSWDTQGLGWDQGNWKGQFDATTGITALDDDTYRNLLRAKIVLNSMDGTIADAALAITQLFSEFPGTIVSIKDNQDMTMTVSISGIVPPAIYLSLLDNGELVVSPTGVSATFTVTSVNSVALFGWDAENATVSGWDVGAWSGAIGIGPGQVTNLALVGVTATTISVSWIAPSVGAAASSYQVQSRLTGSGAPFQLSGQPVTGTQTTVGGFVAGNTYDIQVYAINNAGAGQASPTLAVTIPAGTSVVPQVTNLQVVATPTTSTVPLSWTSLGSGVTYTVQSRPSGVGSFSTLGTTTSTAYTATGLAPNTQYDFQVFGSQGTSGPPSAVLTATTQATTVTPTVALPGVVQNLSAGTINQTDATVTWAAPTTGGVGATYVVFYAINATTPAYNAATGSISSSGNVFSTDITGLQPGTTYLVQVQATNSGGAGPMSPSISITTIAVTPLQVSGLTLVSDTPTSATLSWQPAAQATAYQTQYQQPGDTTWTNGPLVSAPATTATITFPSTATTTSTTTTGTTTTTTGPTITVSVNNAVVKGLGPSIIDSTGASWYIATTGAVTLNGTAQSNTSGVTSIAYVGGTVYLENGSQGTWYSIVANGSTSNITGGPLSSPFTGKTSATQTLLTTGITYVVSAQYTNVVPGNTAFIIDDLGNQWGINSSNQVTINGVADTTTSNVAMLVYVGGLVWRESNNLWFNKASTTAAWAPTAGTATSPIPAGTSTTPAVLNPPTTVTTPWTRSCYDHPGGNFCFWNTPLGDGATWGSPTDADTIDLRHGGYINSVENYGSPFYVSSPTDPTCTFTAPATIREGNVTQSNVSYLVHLPAGAQSAGPPNTDNPISFCDPTNYPGLEFCFGAQTITNFQAGQGPFSTFNGGCWINQNTLDIYCNSVECLTDTYSQVDGMIVGYDIDPTRNKARIPGTNIPRIQKVLRYSHAAIYLKRNDVNQADNVLYGNSWPKLYQDYQGQPGSFNYYTGNLLYGTHVGIPKNVAMPSTLTDAGKMLFDALQNYGSMCGDQSGGGYHLFINQEVEANTTWYDNAANDLYNILVPMLLPMRNQHQAGQNWVDNPVNGPGNRMDPVGPPPLQILPGFPVPSPNYTTFTTAGGGPIVDTLGDKWSFNAAGQVTINGTPDTTSSGVVQMAYVQGIIHVKNSTGTWYGKTARWGVYSAGSANSPLPANLPTPALTPVPTTGGLPDGGVTYNFRVYAIGS